MLIEGECWLLLCEEEFVCAQVIDAFVSYGVDIYIGEKVVKFL